MTSRDYFKNKMVAVIGLGHNGEMVEDVKFLIKAGALVSVYDLKSEARLKNHLVFLRTIGLANYVCGSVPEEDLQDMDIIVLSHEYDRDANFLRSLKNATKKIMVEYPETLFFKQAPAVTVVGVIGECGKSSLMSMIQPLFKSACSLRDSQNFFVIDSESNDGILTHLKKIRSGDIVLIKMTNTTSKELFEMRISPHVAVYSRLPSENSFQKSPFEILAYQTYNNFIVASDDIVDMTHSLKTQPKAKMLRTKTTIIPTDWGIGQKYYPHERENMALAFQTGKLFRVDEDAIQDILTKWKSPKGRMEFIKKIKNVEYYNDGMSVLPTSTELAIKTLSRDRNIVLIFGGAKSDGYYGPLYEVLPNYVHTIVLLPGSGTIVERKAIEKIQNINIKSAPSIEEAVLIAKESANKGDIVLFSPGFEAVGIDGSRKERGEKFIRIVRGL
jgi:UDP-N-acetylmuramoylalanine--D-glutamate ligase